LPEEHHPKHNKRGGHSQSNEQEYQLPFETRNAGEKKTVQKKLRKKPNGLAEELHDVKSIGDKGPQASKLPHCWPQKKMKSHETDPWSGQNG